MEKYIKSFTIILVTIIITAAPVYFAYAQTGGISGGLSSIGGQFQNGQFNVSSVGQLIRVIINVLLYFTGIIAILFIIYGGYLYITAAGNAEQAEKGRTALTNAIMGIALVGFAYVIVNVVANFVQGRVNY